jgi:hypothetical protein
MSYLVEVCLDGTCFLRLSRQMVLTSDHRLFIGVFISEQSINLSKETFQKECKSTYNEYVNDMVSQDSGNKKLFTFVKNKKCENSGIAPLKENGNSGCTRVDYIWLRYV